MVVVVVVMVVVAEMVAAMVAVVAAAMAVVVAVAEVFSMRNGDDDIAARSPFLQVSADFGSWVVIFAPGPCHVVSSPSIELFIAIYLRYDLAKNRAIYRKKCHDKAPQGNNGT